MILVNIMTLASECIFYGVQANILLNLDNKNNVRCDGNDNE